MWLQNKDHVMSKWWKKGIVDIDDVLHGFKNPKSKTLKWFGLDNAQTFESLGDHHGFTADNVNYTFNAHGFRGDDIEQESDFTVLVVGCSHTFGIGLDDKQYWPYHLKNMLAEDYKNPKLINLSFSFFPLTSKPIGWVKTGDGSMEFTYPNYPYGYKGVKAGSKQILESSFEGVSTKKISEVDQHRMDKALNKRRR